MTHDPLVVNTKDGVTWLRRAVTGEGRGLYAVTDSCKCPPYLMATLAELAEHGIAGSADALPMPVGPERLPFPPKPRSEEERLTMQVIDLEGQLAQATTAAARALRERDLMRERVSEPFGCKYCGEAKGFHGRRYLSGMDAAHTWERPSDVQVKTRMLARRVARMPLPTDPEIDRVENELTGANLSLWEEEQDNARLRLALKSAQRGRRELRARVAELEAERHTTNEALSDAAEALRVSRDRETAVAEFAAKRAEYITAIRNCHPDNGHDYDRWQGHAAARRQLSELLGLPVAWPIEDAAAVAKSADKLTRLLAPTQTAREGEHAEAGGE